MGIAPIQVAKQASMRPAGSEPGPATSACSAYEREWLVNASVNPATRSDQPIGLSLRRETITMPEKGMVRFATTTNTPPTLQASDTSGSVAERSRNRKTRPATISAIDARPTDQATRRALRAVKGDPPVAILPPQPGPWEGSMRAG